LVIFWVFSLQTNYRENFTWSQKSTQDYINIEATNDPRKINDINIQQTQASQEELNYFIQNGNWNWSQETQKLYKDAVNRNPYVRTLDQNNLNETMSKYNEKSILQVLSQQTKEGQFLLNGILVPSNNSLQQLPSGYGNFGYNSGLIEDKTNQIIKCNSNGHIERILYTGKGKYNEQTQEKSILDYTQLEKIIPGFKFINKPCNPCKAFNEIPEYSCPFEIQIKQKNLFNQENKNGFISNVWKYLWNV
jgi:hypothetical protein